MTGKKGVLYGLGVGPGDPELITLKAARVLNMVDVVFAASSTKNDYSLALSIAKPHVPDLTKVHILNFPMTRDQEEKEKAWRNCAETIAEALFEGKKAAFITLGDSMTYSTYGYILKYIREIAPDYPVISVPGITSYQAAAAAMNMPLVEQEESMLLTSGAKGGDRLRSVSGKPECVVFLKAYRNVRDIADAIDETGEYQYAAAVSNCGQEGQKIVTNIRELIDTPPNYWTLIFAKKNKN